jgi:hypothetical protein
VQVKLNKSKHSELIAVLKNCIILLLELLLLLLLFVEFGEMENCKFPVGYIFSIHKLYTTYIKGVENYLIDLMQIYFLHFVMVSVARRKKNTFFVELFRVSGFSPGKTTDCTFFTLCVGIKKLLCGELLKLNS